MAINGLTHYPWSTGLESSTDLRCTIIREDEASLPYWDAIKRTIFWDVIASQNIQNPRFYQIYPVFYLKQDFNLVKKKGLFLLKRLRFAHAVIFAWQISNILGTQLSINEKQLSINIQMDMFKADSKFGLRYVASRTALNSNRSRNWSSEWRATVPILSNLCLCRCISAELSCVFIYIFCIRRLISIQTIISIYIFIYFTFLFFII